MTPPKPNLAEIRARLTFAINKRAASLMIDTDALSALLAYAERLEKALRSLIQSHYVCEDCWYSCPKSGECCDESRPMDKCDCGADKANSIIAEALGTEHGG